MFVRKLLKTKRKTATRFTGLPYPNRIPRKTSTYLLQQKKSPALPPLSLSSRRPRQATGELAGGSRMRSPAFTNTHTRTRSQTWSRRRRLCGSSRHKIYWRRCVQHGEQLSEAFSTCGGRSLAADALTPGAALVDGQVDGDEDDDEGGSAERRGTCMNVLYLHRVRACVCAEWL